MKELAFDNELYLKIQREKINERIDSFGDKLYLEFGGKLFDDYHASRVLPGFEPDSKLQMLLGFKDKAEIVIVVNAKDINSNKIRSDTRLTYQDEVDRLIDAFHSKGLYVSGVVLSFYQESPSVISYINKLENNNIHVYKHYQINGYPQNISLVCSDEGLGKNEYIKTTRPLVIVTAPGPGSGKLATCLSQLYHDAKLGIHSGYAKYETFPVWNLPLKHPVNLAYEAATVDLNDVTMIDPFHLEHYGKVAINYNRDVEAFPLLKDIFEKIYGKSPYNSPTDMGVNMIGFAIKNEDVAIQSSKQEIIRRYYQALKLNFFGKFSDECVDKEEMLMKQADVSVEDRKCVQAALDKASQTKIPCMAIELDNGQVVTGKSSDLLGASAAMLLNALKVLANVDDSIPLISPNVIEPIQNLKVNELKKENARLRAEEVLMALSIQSTTNPISELILKQLPKLKGTQAHCSCIISDANLSCLNSLGIDVTEEPVSFAHKLSFKK